MLQRTKPPSVAELRMLLEAFCEKHRIGWLDIFGSAALGVGTPESDRDMLVTPDDHRPRMVKNSCGFAVIEFQEATEPEMYASIHFQFIEES